MLHTPHLVLIPDTHQYSAWAALAPLLLVIGFVLNIVLKIHADPMSHNLWPFEALNVIVLASAVLGLIELCRIAGGRLSHEKPG